MRTTCTPIGLVACIVFGGFAVESAQAEADTWKLGVQAYSFNRFTFFEAIDKVQSLGLHYIEAYPGQKLSQQKQDVIIGPDLPAAIRDGQARTARRVSDHRPTTPATPTAATTNEASLCLLGTVAV